MLLTHPYKDHRVTYPKHKSGHIILPIKNLPVEKYLPIIFHHLPGNVQIP